MRHASRVCVTILFTFKLMSLPIRQLIPQQEAYIAPLYTPKQCGDIATQYNLVPQVSWGTMPESLRTSFETSRCSEQLCQYWMETYNVKPFASFGSLPKQLVKAWETEKMNCDVRAGPYNAEQCRNLLENYNVIPFVSWGASPVYSRAIWESSGCTAEMCVTLKDSFGYDPHPNCSRYNKSGTISENSANDDEQPTVSA